MKVAKSVHELVGNTPIVEITRFPLPKGVRLFAKLEYLNPGGSVKDRLGQELLQDAFESGKLKEGGTIIEPTAGNTGIGLALAAIGKNVNVIFCVPEKFSVEKQQLMRALGATVVHTPTSDGMQGAIKKAKELLAEIPNSYCPQQFANPANPRTYYKTLGPELWEQLDGNIDIFVAGAGTGGTFMGTAQFLKEKNAGIKTVIVEPEGSILNGGEPGPHKTEGIGMEFLPEYMDESYFDAIHTITDEDAFRRVQELAAKEGLLVGSSSGAAFHAAMLEALQAPSGTHIVVIFPDSSERYLSKKIYEGGI
ncbi:cysteine synthase family protein [Anoxybacillus rupiensis]|uniref:Cysteine synthase family protein n=1 Tax=Anoxybacteroides rupiense TaxID=311460 RepID=A0ABD5IT06_9BACL|nr:MULTISPECIES: cysteine synthase family protein [Anoxybacillus]MBS2769934.1 cysteine synthase family protein [Anoxybacillus rupiensis]MDE8562694.1 cysteine synthase family protein [Anoxybacillus rupiensis]MED5050934.1 cysteine synthase family protein [Anoxybacillus rupiensis]QHC04858.1 pyridoxal-phosphate dependent enzyme [Anoxybacillus sp. PDR2]